MDMQKEREAFDVWYYEQQTEIGYDALWSAWQAAKAQAIPDGYKVVPVNYECVWCGCTELDGWTDEAMIEAAQEKEVV